MPKGWTAQEQARRNRSRADPVSAPQMPENTHTPITSVTHGPDDRAAATALTDALAAQWDIDHERARLRTIAKEQYWRATTDALDLAGALGLARIARADALAQLHAAGLSYAQLAKLTGLSRSRCQKLVEDGRARDVIRLRRVPGPLPVGDTPT